MQKPRKNIDLVIPFNNEFQNLQILLPQILKTIKKIKNFNIRIVFIDDGSQDKGYLLIKNYQKKNRNIKILRNNIKMGQTYCYKSYLKKFKSLYFIRMDADNQDDPRNIKIILKYLSAGYDLILTDRKIRKHSFYMIILNLIYDKIISMLIDRKLDTYSSSLVCYKTNTINYRYLKNNDHRYLPIISIFNGVKKIKVFPVMHKERKFGVTKYGILKKIFFALPEFLYFYYRLKKGLYTK